MRYCFACSRSSGEAFRRYSSALICTRKQKVKSLQWFKYIPRYTKTWLPLPSKVLVEHSGFTKIAQPFNGCSHLRFALIVGENATDESFMRKGPFVMKLDQQSGNNKYQEETRWCNTGSFHHRLKTQLCVLNFGFSFVCWRLCWVSFLLTASWLMFLRTNFTAVVTCSYMHQ